MRTFCWIATAVCMAGTAANVYRLNLCFLLWIVGEIMWLAFDLKQNLYSRTVLDLLGLAFAVWGLVHNW